MIVLRDGAAGRRPALAGSRLDVSHVVETFEAPVRAVDVLLRRFSGEEDFGNLVEWL